MKSPISLAYKNGQHVVMRAFTKGSARETPEAVTPDSLNRLILARNLLALMESIDELGIMLDHDLTEKDTRILTVGEVLEDIRKGVYSPVRDSRLTDEIYMDSRFPQKPNASALRRMDASYDLMMTDFASTLRTFDTDDTVVVELVQDWMELRNSLSVTARVLGYMINPPSNVAGKELAGDFNGLLEAGFEKRDLKRNRLSQLSYKYDFFENYSKQYQISFTHNAFLATDPGLRKIPQLLKTFESKSPLHHSVLSQEKGWSSALKSSNRIDFFAAPVAKYYQQEKDDRKNYLCIGDNGEDWQSLSREFVEAMVLAYMEPEIDRNHWFKNQGYPEVKKDSLIEALWYQLIFPKTYELIICQNCGNAALTAKKGGHTLYCTGACSANYRNHYKNKE